LGLKEYGSWVAYDFEFPDERYDPMVAVKAGRVSPVPQMLIDGLGVDFFHKVVCAEPRHPNCYKSLSGLEDLRALKASSAALQYVPHKDRLRRLNVYLDEDDSDPLDGFTGLQYLNISAAHPAAEWKLGAISRMPELEELSLYDGQLTDKGLESLAGLKHLKVFRWQSSRDETTLEGIRSLACVASLEELYLSDSHPVTADELNELAKLPNLKTLLLAPQDLLAMQKLHTLRKGIRKSVWPTQFRKSQRGAATGN